jgi:hypothetical protein
VQHRVASKFPSETSEYTDYAKELDKVSQSKFSSSSMVSL